MPLPRHLRPITTKANITALFHMAEEHGEITIRLPDKRACYLTRNRLYKHRAELRKQSLAHTGVNASHLDGFKITYKPEGLEDRDSDGIWHRSEKYLLTIAYDQIIEFELMLTDEQWAKWSIPDLDLAPEEPIQDLCDDLDCPRCAGSPDSTHTGTVI